jgi:N-acetylmuramoyl-L-alanine amidase
MSDRRNALRRIQLILGGIAIAAFLGILLVGGQSGSFRLWGMDGGFAWRAAPRLALPIALISGHAGNDSGAVCTDEDGNVLITEAEINAQIADQVRQRLERQSLPAIVLDEFDSRLDGLRATLLLSLHADSCINRSGYKAAHRLNSRLPEAEGRLVACIDEHYAAITGLAPDPDTVTPNMTEYHAYRKIERMTPAAVLEMGFLGTDQTLITQRSDLVAAAIVESILCFLAEGEPSPPAK